MTRVPPGDVFRVVASPGRSDTRVKGSHFHGWAAPCRSEDSAVQLLASERKERHDATHHCSAWRVGSEADVWRANDDGEPSGTAGMPILRQIEASRATNCLVVVTRYYGGIKLGTGGLARAYGDAARLALKDARFADRLRTVEFVITHEYSDTLAATVVIERFGARVVKADYSDRTRLRVAVPRSLASEFEHAVTEALAGRGSVEFGGRHG